MAKSINLKNDIYIDSDSIVDRRIKLKDKLLHGYTGSNKYYSSLADFKNQLITAEYLLGVYLVDLNINGTIYTAIVQKASNSYLSFVLFGYSHRIHEYKYNNGSWTDFQYLREDKIQQYISTNSIDVVVSTLINEMTHEGVYNFVGGWSGHSYGYTAICQCARYDDSSYAYSGIIFEYANGHVYTFTQRTNGTVKINTLV